MKVYGRSMLSEKKPWLMGLTLACLLAGALLLTSLVRLDLNVGSRLCSVSDTAPIIKNDNTQISQSQLRAIIHYATSTIVPQQSLAEISVTFHVIQSYGPNRPLNFLVFGLGHDSLMWDSLNPLGTTLFLEEDPKWVQTVLKDNPNLNARHVSYRTQLKQADELLARYRAEPRCSPSRVQPLKGNAACQLALENLPDEVYEKEWDLIMIDAPRGYFAEAPGRMAAVFSAAVMARNRRGSGATHVFLHDVDRRVEKTFAEEFLCRKYLVKAVGRLWYFKIPANVSRSDAAQDSNDAAGFCYLPRDVGNSKA